MQMQMVGGDSFANIDQVITPIQIDLSHYENLSRSFKKGVKDSALFDQ